MFRLVGCRNLSVTNPFIFKKLVLHLLYSVKKRIGGCSFNLSGITHFTSDFMGELLTHLKIHFWNNLHNHKIILEITSQIIFVKFSHIMEKRVLYFEERTCRYFSRGTSTVWIKALFEVWTLKSCPYMHFSMSQKSKSPVFHGPCVVVTVVKIDFWVTTVVCLILWSSCSHSWQRKLD